MVKHIPDDAFENLTNFQTYLNDYVMTGDVDKEDVLSILDEVVSETSDVIYRAERREYYGGASKTKLFHHKERAMAWAGSANEDDWEKDDDREAWTTNHGIGDQFDLATVVEETVEDRP